MRSQHQQLCFQDSGLAKWHVYRHLVTVKVSIERCTNQRVQLNGFTFYQLWLESLCSVGARFNNTGCPFNIFSRISQMTGSFLSTSFLADLTVLTIPRSISL